MTADTKQSSPSQQYQSISRMTKLVCLNIGGKQYKVSCSLFDMHPNSLLAKSASEQWLSDPDEEIFLDQDGYRFRFDINPKTICKVLEVMSMSTLGSDFCIVSTSKKRFTSSGVK